MATITAEHVNSIFKNLPIAPSGNRVRVFCKDGFNVSVQASQYHYSTPREADASYYEEFELGFPSEHLLELEEWSEDTDCCGVFGYVPAEELAKVFEAHGGVDFPAIMASAGK